MSTTLTIFIHIFIRIERIREIFRGKKSIVSLSTISSIACMHKMHINAAKEGGEKNSKHINRKRERKRERGREGERERQRGREWERIEKRGEEEYAVHREIAYYLLCLLNSSFKFNLLQSHLLLLFA